MGFGEVGTFHIRAKGQQPANINCFMVVRCCLGEASLARSTQVASTVAPGAHLSCALSLHFQDPKETHDSQNLQIHEKVDLHGRISVISNAESECHVHSWAVRGLSKRTLNHLKSLGIGKPEKSKLKAPCGKLPKSLCFSVRSGHTSGR